MLKLTYNKKRATALTVTPLIQNRCKDGGKILEQNNHPKNSPKLNEG